MDTKNKINAFAVNYKLKLFSNFKLFIISSILNILGAPLMVISMIMAVYEDEQERIAEELNLVYDYSYTYDFYATISAFAMIVLFAVIIITAFSTFQYLYSKPMVDVVYSLPVTSRQRFFSNYLAGFSTFGIPYVISIIITFIIDLIAKITFPVWTEHEANFTVVIAIASITLFLAMLMLYTTTIFVLTFCGSIIEGIGYTFIFNALIPIVTSVVIAFIDTVTYGMNTDVLILDIIMYISVFGSIIATAEIFDGYSEDLSLFQPEFIIWVLVYLLVIGIIFGFSYFLYTRRKAEDVSKPFVFKSIYYVMMTCILFCMATGMIMCWIDYSVADCIPWVMASAILFLILDTITNRGFKKFGVGIIKYCCMTGGSLLILTLIMNSDCFGVAMRIPKAENVKGVTVSYPSNIFSTNGYNSTEFDKNDVKEIEAIINAHQTVIDDYSEYLETNPDVRERIDYETDSNYNSLEITYNLKSGISYSRYYSSVNYETVQKLNELYLSEKNIGIIENDLYERLKYGEAKRTGFISGTLADKFGNDLSYTISVENYKILVSKYIKDLKSTTLSEITNEAETYGYFCGEPVLKSYRNTIEFLESLGYIIDDCMDYYNISENMQVLIAPDGSFLAENYNTDFIATNMYFTFGDIENEAYEVKLSFSNREEFIELMQYAEPCYYTDNIHCPVIDFQGNNYIIPEKYADKVDEFMDSLLRAEYRTYREYASEIEGSYNYYS